MDEAMQVAVSNLCDVSTILKHSIKEWGILRINPTDVPRVRRCDKMFQMTRRAFGSTPKSFGSANARNCGARLPVVGSSSMRTVGLQTDLSICRQHPLKNARICARINLHANERHGERKAAFIAAAVRLDHASCVLLNANSFDDRIDNRVDARRRYAANASENHERFAARSALS